MKVATLAIMSVFVACLGAQTTQTTETKTTTVTSSGQQDGTVVNLNGTLVDSSCVSTHSRHKETDSDDSGTKTTETTRVTTDCPVTTTTTSFGLLTSDGRVMRLDDAGNTRVVEMFKTNKDWRNYMEGRKPVRVRVVGTPNGDVVVVKEIR